MKTLLISNSPRSGIPLAGQFKKYGIKPSKKLGQNFLIDKSILEKIIAAADLSTDDIVLEVGPGMGILTLELAKKAKKVIAVEKDGKLCEVLKNILNEEKIKNVEIINADILKTRYEIQDTRYKLVANLPYYITSPVIRKFLEIKKPPKEMILMVQKEVAQRICAAPPRMNLLAIAVQFYGKPGIIGYVDKKSFWPQPKVDSAMIKIIPQPIPNTNVQEFFNLVKIGFSSKRKTLINNLSAKLNIKKPILEELFRKTNLNPKARAENLSINEWIKLHEAIESNF